MPLRQTSGIIHVLNLCKTQSPWIRYTHTPSERNPNSEGGYLLVMARGMVISGAALATKFRPQPSVPQFVLQLCRNSEGKNFTQVWCHCDVISMPRSVHYCQRGRKSETTYHSGGHTELPKLRHDGMVSVGNLPKFSFQVSPKLRDKIWYTRNRHLSTAHIYTTIVRTAMKSSCALFMRIVHCIPESPWLCRSASSAFAIPSRQEAGWMEARSKQSWILSK